MKRLYMGIRRPYNPKASAPSSFERIIENIKPNIPVNIFEELKIKDFYRNFYFPKIIPPFYRILY